MGKLWKSAANCGELDRTCVSGKLSQTHIWGYISKIPEKMGWKNSGGFLQINIRQKYPQVIPM